MSLSASSEFQTSHIEIASTGRPSVILPFYSLKPNIFFTLIFSESRNYPENGSWNNFLGSAVGAGGRSVA